VDLGTSDVMFVSTVPFARLFIGSDIVISRYLMNGLNNFDKADREYSLSPTDDLIIF